MQSNQVNAVKGTMKFHAVVGQGVSRIKVREVSCYCEECIAGDTCDAWGDDFTRPQGPTNTETSAVRTQNEQNNASQGQSNM
ncbi:hypothetical protein DPMN_037708 [Dreissena polymorpha]|uniref:Uncharacterized protein n=1 Tax=Dreissena polymorpha TaxID=45954 RepID=A0A9D4MF07_DREPO|nr:hypothetical protein DPMN_037708 [Dreissena polymorpha]